MNNSKYPQGYLPKIVYHMVQGNQDKVEYFVGRQVATYGPLTEKDRHTMAKMYFTAMDAVHVVNETKKA